MNLQGCADIHDNDNVPQVQPCSPNKMETTKTKDAILLEYKAYHNQRRIEMKLKEQEDLLLNTTPTITTTTTITNINNIPRPAIPLEPLTRNGNKNTNALEIAIQTLKLSNSHLTSPTTSSSSSAAAATAMLVKQPHSNKLLSNSISNSSKIVPISHLNDDMRLVSTDATTTPTMTTSTPTIIPTNMTMTMTTATAAGAAVTSVSSIPMTSPRFNVKTRLNQLLPSMASFTNSNSTMNHSNPPPPVTPTTTASAMTMPLTAPLLALKALHFTTQASSFLHQFFDTSITSSDTQSIIKVQSTIRRFLCAKKMILLHQPDVYLEEICTRLYDECCRTLPQTATQFGINSTGTSTSTSSSSSHTTNNVTTSTASSSTTSATTGNATLTSFPTSNPTTFPTNGTSTTGSNAMKELILGAPNLPRIQRILNDAKNIHLNLLQNHTSNSYTVLHAACQRGYLELTKMLLTAWVENNGKATKRTRQCELLFLLHQLVNKAKQRGQLLRECGLEVTATIRALKLSSEYVLNALEKYYTMSVISMEVILKICGHPLVLAKDRYGNMPLHFAAEGGYVELCCYLLEQGAPIDAQNVRGETPLHLAISSRHERVCRMFVENKANVNLCMFRSLELDSGQKLYGIIVNSPQDSDICANIPTVSAVEGKLKSISRKMDSIVYPSKKCSVICTENMSVETFMYQLSAQDHASNVVFFQLAPQMYQRANTNNNNSGQQQQATSTSAPICTPTAPTGRSSIAYIGRKSSSNIRKPSSNVNNYNMNTDNSNSNSNSTTNNDANSSTSSSIVQNNTNATTTTTPPTTTTTTTTSTTIIKNDSSRRTSTSSSDTNIIPNSTTANTTPNTCEHTIMVAHTTTTIKDSANLDSTSNTGSLPNSTGIITTPTSANITMNVSSTNTNTATTLLEASSTKTNTESTTNSTLPTLPPTSPTSPSTPLTGRKKSKLFAPHRTSKISTTDTPSTTIPTTAPSNVETISPIHEDVTWTPNYLPTPTSVPNNNMNSLPNSSGPRTLLVLYIPTHISMIKLRVARERQDNGKILHLLIKYMPSVAYRALNAFRTPLFRCRVAIPTRQMNQSWHFQGGLSESRRRKELITNMQLEKRPKQYYIVTFVLYVVIYLLNVLLQCMVYGRKYNPRRWRVKVNTTRNQIIQYLTIATTNPEHLKKKHSTVGIFQKTNKNLGHGGGHFGHPTGGNGNAAQFSSPGKQPPGFGQHGYFQHNATSTSTDQYESMGPIGIIYEYKYENEIESGYSPTFELIIETECKELMAHPWVEKLRDQKWRVFGKKYFHREMYLYTVFFISFFLSTVLKIGDTSLGMLQGGYHSGIFDKEVTKWDYIRSISTTISTIINFIYTYRHLYEIQNGGLLLFGEYIANIWNIFDVILLGGIWYITLTDILSYIANSNSSASDWTTTFQSYIYVETDYNSVIWRVYNGYTTILCITGPLIFIRWLQFCRGSRNLGPFVRIIYQMVGDISMFLFVFLLFLFGFAFAFFVLQLDGFRTLVSSTNSVYQISLGGWNWEPIALGGPLGVLLFYAYSCFGTIMMLNLLVAMFGRTYAEVWDDRLLFFHLERSKTILKFQKNINIEKYRRKYWCQTLFVLERDEPIQGIEFVSFDT